jgi:hypothetical protein
MLYTMPVIKINSRRKCRDTIISLPHPVKSFVVPVRCRSGIQKANAVIYRRVFIFGSRGRLAEMPTGSAFGNLFDSSNYYLSFVCSTRARLYSYLITISLIDSNTKLRFWLSRYITEFWMKGGIIGGMIEVEMCFLHKLSTKAKMRDFNQ